MMNLFVASIFCFFYFLAEVKVFFAANNGSITP